MYDILTIYQGIPGYWIRAYRNLTSVGLADNLPFHVLLTPFSQAMIADLRKDSLAWRHERRAGTRGTLESNGYDDSRFAEPDSRSESYVGSSTYHQSTANRASGQRRDGDSPRAPEYGAPQPSRGERAPAGRMPVDRMDMDPPQPPRTNGGYGQPEPRYQQDGRAFAADGRSYQEQQPVAPAFGGRPPVTSAGYGQNVPGYAPVYPPQQPASNDAPPGYVRQGNHYVPINPVPSGYEAVPPMPASRSDAQPFGGNPMYGQPQPPPGRDPRYPQPEYADPRYAYPSPAVTVTSIAARDREPVTSPSSQQRCAYQPLGLETTANRKAN